MVVDYQLPQDCKVIAIARGDGMFDPRGFQVYIYIFARECSKQLILMAQTNWVINVG